MMADWRAIFNTVSTSERFEAMFQKHGQKAEFPARLDGPVDELLHLW